MTRQNKPELTPWPVVFGIVAGVTLWGLALHYLTTLTLVVSYLLAVAYVLWLLGKGKRERAHSLLSMLAYPTFLFLKWLWMLISSPGEAP